MVVAKHVDRRRSGRRSHKSGDGARAPRKRTLHWSGRVSPRSLAFFHPNVKFQVEFHFLFTAWVRHPQRAEIDPRVFFFFFACALRTGFSECRSRGAAPSGGRGGSRSRAGGLEPLWRKSACEVLGGDGNELRDAMTHINPPEAA